MDDDRYTQTERIGGTYHARRIIALVHWHDRGFHDLTVDELYWIMALRERVFVVEQDCPYLEADGFDPVCRHVFATRGAGTTELADLLAYLRVVPPSTRYAELSIGRVIVAPAARKLGLGKELMARGFAAVVAHHGDVPIKIGAQAYLERFYTELGFRRISDNYDEDGIPHLYMLRAPSGHA